MNKIIIDGFALGLMVLVSGFWFLVLLAWHKPRQFNGNQMDTTTMQYLSLRE